MKASEMRAKTRLKIQQPGIYTKLDLVKVEKDDKKFNFEFETEDNQYQTVSIFYTINEDNLAKGLETQFRKKNMAPSGEGFRNALAKRVVEEENKVVTRLVEIADAIGDPEQVSKAEGKNFLDLAEKLYKYIEILFSKDKAESVNVKVAMDYKDEWTEIPKGSGSIEKYIENKDPMIKFTQWEIDNGKNVRPKSSATSNSGNSSFDTDFSAFKSLASNPTQTTGDSQSDTSDRPSAPINDENDLPF